MKNLTLMASVLMVVAGCKQTASTSGGDGGGAVATADSASTKTTASSVVDKALSFLGGGPFEGEITMNVTEAGKPPHTITYDVKGTKMRFDSPAEQSGPMGGGYVIFDTTNKKMTAVNDAKKSAFIMDVNAMGAQNPAMAQAAQTKPNVEKTGKTDTVAGYSCEIWHVSDEKGSGDVCVAKGISFPKLGRGAPSWQSMLEDGFPLRAVMNDSTGKEKDRMEVTKIDKKSLDDSRFEVPAGYQTMNMEDMMKGLGGLRQMGGAMGRPPR
jgi:hypothetical protein